jgi:hypothetical protein
MLLVMRDYSTGGLTLRVAVANVSGVQRGAALVERKLPQGEQRTAVREARKRPASARRAGERPIRRRTSAPNVFAEHWRLNLWCV